MANITILDQSTINKIAAGEVIERPAAVVKELIENAIDAGANAITTEIKEGGISFIRVTDNGSGILKADIPIAFLRHSTSKIKTVEDLLSVSSLGFRGEALSSIAAVSQLELVTKTPGEINGVRYIIEGGEEKSIEEIGCPEGTTFIIRNIFYNTPARRKFLKSTVTEAGYISDLIERLAVSHPNVSFKFIVNNQIKLHTSGNNNLKDIIYNVYGRELSANIIEANGKSDHIVMSGFIGKPIISRGNRNYMNYYINGRYIKSGIINKAIEEAYKPYTMTHRYPFTALHFEIDSELIDINVHPTKMEIRFKNGEEIYSIVYHTIKDALAGKELIPEVVLVKEKEEDKKLRNIPEPFEKNRIKGMEDSKRDSFGRGNYENRHNSTSVEREIPEKIKETEIGKFQSMIAHPEERIERLEKDQISADYNVLHDNQSQYSTDVDKNTAVSAQTVSDTVKGEQIGLFEDKLLSEEAKKSHRIIGQLFSTYWIVEYSDKMFIIDQHAAHEKVLYEKTMKAIKDKEYSSQMINPPIILTLSMREEEALKKHLESLNQLGFEIEAFGGKEYSVRAVPADLFGIAEKELLIELIDTLVEEIQSENPDIILEKVASMSCKAAVKGNNKLSFKEAESLIDQLLTLENPYHCPHGRPTIVSMSKYEIEKKFKRIV
ncbi:DNA mismatch repair protein MutL [Mobilisporobacter senegalensis]|uniref:DNA mismatch repair protein MutL n=1 Tax=Mobilisporobacter senegalensis TaxID=1329262 RepID=A0A3N1XRU0_9FIRM|nr:DNA mismatch repair endonuclease MutL [Mobilisporobacter senegalensis]ROR29379.1 DNA mismatch repair protein MutL [Mobilisporobacter senegalensis]